jgi:hypothetical protein
MNKNQQKKKTSVSCEEDLWQGFNGLVLFSLCAFLLGYKDAMALLG